MIGVAVTEEAAVTKLAAVKTATADAAVEKDATEKATVV